MEPPRAAVNALYRWWLQRLLDPARLPEHIAIIMDGNRRWARRAGFADPGVGHQHGANHLEPVLSWCSDIGIRHVTVWVASADNIRKRDPEEVAFLMHVAETTIAAHLSRNREWRIHVAGQLDLLPSTTSRALKAAEEATRDLQDAGDLTVAIGYGGREEIADAVRAILHEAATEGRSPADVAANLSEQDIARHLHRSGQPYPDLVIRTSGEQRMSDFLLWQAADADLYFVDAYWPSFRHIDLLRVLRSHAIRSQRAR
jgi:short-chain Z-isoprenyl diphosphate synthase